MNKKELLNEKDFKEFESTLHDDCLRILRDFSKTNDNMNVYAFVIDGDPDHGGISICMNTIDSFQSRVKQRYSDYSEGELYGINGLKYSVGDFVIRFDGQLSEQLYGFLNKYYHVMVDQLDFEYKEQEEEYEKNRKRFTNCLINVCNKLKKDFSLLHKTDDFLGFVTLHDIREETFIELMKSTVDEAIFNKVFPEIPSPSR